SLGLPTVSDIFGSLAAASREVQRAAVVRVLRTEQISRSLLISRLGISSSLVTRLVRGLLDDGIIEEVGIATSALGRPPVRLALRAGYGHFVAVSCEGDRLRAGVYDLQGIEIRLSVIALEGKVLSVSAITNSIDGVEKDAGVSGERLLGVGISVPGVVDARTGAVSEAPELGWQ